MTDASSYMRATNSETGNLAQPESRPAWNTPEAIDIMKALWAAGKSATEIGNHFGVTKNAILGKIHRLGLHRHLPKPPPKPREPKRRKEPTNRSRTTPTPGQPDQARASPPPGTERHVAPEATPVPAPLPAFRIRPTTCRWPLWSDHAKADHTYCGKPAIAAWPGIYCLECRNKAIVKR